LFFVLLEDNGVVSEQLREERRREKESDEEKIEKGKEEKVGLVSVGKILTWQRHVRRGIFVLLFFDIFKLHQPLCMEIPLRWPRIDHVNRRISRRYPGDPPSTREPVCRTRILGWPRRRSSMKAPPGRPPSRRNDIVWKYSGPA